MPSALTWIIASLHVAFGFAIIGAIVGEFLGAQKGLGLVIATAQNNFDPNGVFAAMLIIAVIALTAEGLIAQLERRLLAWRPPSPTETVPASDARRRVPRRHARIHPRSRTTRTGGDAPCSNGLCHRRSAVAALAVGVAACQQLRLGHAQPQPPAGHPADRDA